MTGPKLSFENVSVVINQVTLLSPVTLSLEEGLWHGIAGPNGGGKSTLLKSLCGLMPHQGKIKIHWPQKSNKKFGYMPQLAPFEASLPITVMDFLRMNCESHAVWFKRRQNKLIDDVVEKVDISSLLDKRLGTLSMGERQRVLLATAMAEKPKLLLLDEPLAGLDKKGQMQMLALLSDFKEQGGTIIMIEHNWQIIQQNCDTLSWINGELRATGTPDDVLTNITNSYSSFDLARSA